MDQNIYILVVEDELEVMDALVKDLERFETFFPIETANNATEAEEVVKYILDHGHTLGLILCDHVLPGKNGIDLLIEMQDSPETSACKKVLVTGQAGHEDTILAINQAKLNHYISKPWTKAQLEKVVADELTHFVIEQKRNLLPFMQILNAEKLAKAMRDNTWSDR